MENYNIQHDTISVVISKDNIHINNSVNIIYKEDIEDILNEYRHKYNSSIFYDFIINKRSIKSMTYEWGAHNLLHQIGLLKYCDKNLNLKYEPLYKIIPYYILGWIWFKFNDKYDLDNI